MPVKKKKKITKKLQHKILILKEFFAHLIAYMVTVLILFFVDITTAPGKWFFHWALIGWGAILILHAGYLFGFHHLFSRGWEKEELNKILKK